MATFKHVLAATDFSEASGRALEMAVTIARDAGAQLTVAHVAEVPTYTEFAAPVDLVTPITDLAETRLEELLESLRHVCPGVKGAVRVGAPWEQILAAAAEAGADLVVLGTHGRRGFAHAFMGSVAERVVRLSPIPVLTVRSRVAS
jgi:nucleotide-binding universal stress UspA family protein